MAFSRTQVDRLGERLRRGDVSDDDLRLLDAYRRSFAEPFAAVFDVLRDELGLAPTGRSAKSTKSIIDKLNRESPRLSQVQDIAGCRVVTADVAEQNRAVEAIAERFGAARIVDRRTRPSNGYRAVHVLVPVRDLRVEVQVRTVLQHFWAELSEKLSDRLGIAIKYGGGSEPMRAVLDGMSQLVALIEERGEALAGPLELSDCHAQLHAKRQAEYDEAWAVLLEIIARFTAPDA